MYSKISGAHGKYGTIDPELERTALEILGFKPFYGATQIMPRILYAPIAQALSGIVQVLNNIATDIRLGARSGRPIMREPFSKKQKGSSAMPQKRNPILTEQVGGLDRMARHYAGMITENVHTWEERAIEQSCVERVAWPDLFHVVIRALKVMNTVLSGLRVYPDNMLREIHESRGTYAASEVKEFLKEKLGEVGLGHEDGYRITQLACFNVFEATEVWKTIHEMVPKSLEQSRSLLAQVKVSPVAEVVSIQDFIPAAALRMTDELDITEEQIARYNSCLIKLFSDAEVMKSWNQLFDPAFLLKNEEVLYREILGD
jgi:adenylosuccinate lyase